jgi:dihydroorotate dehydrogenase (fumarate)
MDLSTTYMGLKLAHPVVASASPISYTLDGIRSLEIGGASAIVLYSLFEEQIEGESHLLDHYLDYGSETFAEALDYFPDLDNYNVGPQQYLNLIKSAKAAVNVPIIASLNGVSPGGWTSYARRIEEAGADALELNIYLIPTDAMVSGADVEQMYLDIVREVKSSVQIPIAVKVGPYFSSFANMAHRLAEAGADALVIFNRFYQPDLDLEQLDVVPNLVLSTREELRLPLRWAAILHGHIPVDLALTSGVHTHEDVLKGLMAGANVTMMTSELLKKGPGRINEIVSDLRNWMVEHEYESVTQMRGSMSQRNVAQPAAFVRANYMKVLQSWRPDTAGMRAR